MCNIDIKNIRNIGISAHIDAGKTTTTERILYYTGVNYKIGEVHEGKATMDWMDQEQERGITITSAATTVFWAGSKNNLKTHKINIIDTPGHVDFTVEVERSMRVLDGVCMVYCAVAGVQAQSETVWRQSNRYNISKIIYVNKMDRQGNDFYKLLDDLKFKLKANPLPLFIPYFYKESFSGIIDLINFKLIIWDDFNKGLTFNYFDIPKNYLNISIVWREKIIECVLEENENLINKFLENSLNNEDIITEIRKKTLSNSIQPMLCGSSFKNKGVQALLDVIVNYLPSPADICEIKGFSMDGNVLSVSSVKNTDFIALVFKVINDIFLGQLVFFRVYSGKLEAGDFVINTTRNNKEKISRLLRIHANNKEDIKIIAAGDIAAAVGLKNIYTGDTLCALHGEKIVLEKINFPEPVISQSLTICNKSDEEKILLILDRTAREDPSFKFHIDKDSKQIIISGMGELHLDVTIEKIRREHSLKLFTSKPKVSYKETPKKPVYKIEGKYIRQSGGRGQYGHVIIDLEPAERGKGFKFVNKIKGGAIPKEYIPAIEKSFEHCVEYGTLYGFPVVDLIIYLVGGSYHDVDSSENAFKIASNIAFKEALKNSFPVLLEPIMNLNIEIPDEFSNIVLSNISSKRGSISQIENLSNNYKILKCLAPLVEILSYSTDLRSLTKGRGSYDMFFSFYQEVPINIVKNIF